MIISKEFTFDAAHQLPDEECYGQCRNLHGHTYRLIVEVVSKINEKGWVMNFKDLKTIVNELFISKYDHWFLNDYYTVSTAEYMAQYMFNTLTNYLIEHHKQLGTVKVKRIMLWETPTSCAVCEHLDDLPEGIVKDHDKQRDRNRIKVTMEG